MVQSSQDQGQEKLLECSLPSNNDVKEADEINSDTFANNDSNPGVTRKSNNPFLNTDSMETPLPYTYTSINSEELKKYPFKTLNRILDDIHWTIPYKLQCPDINNSSLLNRKAIDYSHELARIASLNSRLTKYEMLILSNALEYSPSIEKIRSEDENQTLTLIRGLIVNKSDVNHFRLSILENDLGQSASQVIDKHEYHLIPKHLLSQDDLDTLLNKTDIPKFPENLIDDAYFKSLNSPNNHILRVSIFSPEFSNDDLFPLHDQETIKKRYLNEIEKHPDSNLSPETIPTSVHCFKTLVKVLKGPILLPPGQSIKTINVNNSSLNSQLDLQLLFNKLSFKVSENELIPPDVVSNPYLRESYIRKIQEIIYVARIYGSQPNEFSSVYTFSDSLSLVYRTFNEFDKHMCQTFGRNHDSNQLPFCINLNICTFFQDELIIKCFENTIKSDPSNKLYYVDSLKNVINYRTNLTSSSGKLRAYYTNLSQKGELIGFSDYEIALKALGIESGAADSNRIDDDFVIVMYTTSYKNDPKNYAYFNNLLRTIGKVRNSDTINEFLKKEIIPLNLAIDELNIEELTEDEVVITAYEFKMDDTLTSNGFNTNSNEVTFLNKALLSVAFHRKSYILMNYIEVKLPNVMGAGANYSFTDSLEVLDCELSANDFEVITKFQSKLTNLTDPGDIRVLRLCLKTVAKERKSKILSSFLASGKIDSSLLPAENWPAGLDNIGNTCYLNSLLQYYFCIKPLRDMILAFDERKIDQTKQKNRKIGGRKVEDAEIQRSNQFIYHLRNLFNDMIYTDMRCVQPSKELAYLSFLPLSQPVSFKSENTGVQPEKQDVVDLSDNQDEVENSKDSPILVSSESSSTSGEVEMIDEPSIIKSDDDMTSDSIEDISTPDKSNSIHSDRKDDEPRILPISTDQMESTIEVGRQQDVTECIENVTFQIETALEPESLEDDNEQYDMIKKLFSGKTKQTITPLDAQEKERISYERFFSLIINVSDHPKDIYDSLDNYFSEDTVKLEEGLVKKSLTISQLPNVLQFHVQRVMFDREKLMAYKSIEPIPFGENIYLDRYLDTEDEDILRKRSEVFQWKSEIKQLRSQKDELLRIDDTTSLSIMDSLIATKKFLEAKVITHETLSVNAETIVVLQEQIDNLKQKLETIDTDLQSLGEKVSNQFTSYTKVGYSIFAIFIHRGEASYGHYWVYIRDPTKNVFRKYNDETVTEVPASEVFNFVEGNTATPYYIVYVKDELKEEYIEPLKRVINKC